MPAARGPATAAEVAMAMNLTRAREARSWSRTELARPAGVNATTISLIESARFRPYPGQLAKLTAAVGIAEHCSEWLLQEAATSVFEDREQSAERDS